jgi:hypothetical protein
MPSNESKRERFRRLATHRTNAVLHRLQILGHCANPQLYDYSEEDVRKIFRAIDSEVRTIRARFSDSSSSEFQL